MSRIPGPKPLNVAQQLMCLRSNAICSGSGGLVGRQLEWRYYAQPTPVSDAKPAGESS